MMIGSAKARLRMMDVMLETGISLEESRTVGPDDVIRFLGDAVPPSLATARMIWWMEIACRDLAFKHLDEGQDTVGVRVEVEHLAPTPLEVEVVYRARLESVESREVRFAVEASSDGEIVGRGFHDRVVIDIERFARQIRAKLGKR